MPNAQDAHRLALIALSTLSTQARTWPDKPVIIVPHTVKRWFSMLRRIQHSALMVGLAIAGPAVGQAQSVVGHPAALID